MSQYFCRPLLRLAITAPYEEDSAENLNSIIGQPVVLHCKEGKIADANALRQVLDHYPSFSEVFSQP